MMSVKALLVYSNKYEWMCCNRVTCRIYRLEGIDVSLLSTARSLSTKDYKFQGNKKSFIYVPDDEL